LSPSGAYASEAALPARAAASDIDRLGAHVSDHSRSDRARLKTARALVQFDDPRALTHLFQVITDKNTGGILRAGFVDVLVRSPRRADVTAFTARRLADREEISEVRAASARVLGRQKAEFNVRTLFGFIDDPESSVRLEARNALLAIDGPGVDSVDLLTRTLREREQPAAARASAARALGQLGDRRATPGLLAALTEDVPVLPSPKTVEELYGRAAAVNQTVPIAAARALGRIGDEAAVPELLEHAGHSEPEMRIAVFEALARIDDSAAVPAARKALTGDKELRVRRWAAVLLKKQRDPDTLPDLRRALEQDEDPGVRLQAVQALESMNDRESVARIRSALEKEKLKEVRAAMEHALVRLAPPAVSTTTN